MDVLTKVVVVIFGFMFCLVILGIMNSWRRYFNPRYFVYETKGECVPVATTGKNGKVIEVFCQDCTKPMTLKEHKEYFDKYIPWFEKKFKQKYSIARPNYDQEERKGE